MGAQRIQGVGGYHTGEGYTIYSPTSGVISGMPLVIVCHGSDSRGAAYYMSQHSTHRDLNYLASLGCFVLCIDHGLPSKPDNWGNDIAVDRVTEAITWANVTFGCSITRVGLIADSAGGPTALRWSWLNPTQLGGCILRAGVVAIQLTHDRNALLEALIDAAYTNHAGWVAAAPTHDPTHANQIPLISAISDRVLIFYSSGDGLILPSDITALVASTGVQALVIGNMAHDGDLLAAAFPAAYQAQWLLDRIGTA